ncbi:MAG: substrate-binding domain-containing protein [Deltaproteobacteria bacterium]|nr:substrate-binding domain-containing protein [Deltaproteobacteria bacterium]
MKGRFLSVLVAWTVVVGVSCSSGTGPGDQRSERPVVLATTTSTHDTGLLDNLIPKFEEQTGLIVKTVAVGTGQALELGRRGEADVLLVHAPSAEKTFIDDGHGKNRRAVMHNDFVVVGPGGDPARLRGVRDAAAALKTLSVAQATWVSRGDRSGTHTKETELWMAAGVEPAGAWYVETGQGMGASLRIASERRGYTLSDRGSFIATANLELELLLEGDPRLFNPYHVVEVVGPNVNAKGAAALAGFFVERETQEAIRDFKFHGRQLFTPDALE